MMRQILLAIAVLALCGCHHHFGPHKDHRSINLIAYDYDTGAAAAVFTVTQTAYDYADDSCISLSVRSLSGDPISFNFDLNVYGYDGYYGRSFIYTNAVVELAPGASHSFGKISEAELNIYDSNVYLTSPIYIVYLPTGPG
jgi:hypothetical protein